MLPSLHIHRNWAGARLVLTLLAGLLAAAAARAEDPAPEPDVEAPAAAPRVVALATSAPVAIVVGTPVQFQDTSTGGPTSWTWDFSYDGAQPVTDSTAQNPVWTFAQTGVWPVRLGICNDTGCSAATRDVTVVEPCTLLDDLALPDLLGPILDLPVTYEACHTITTSGALSILQGGDVRLRAGRTIVLGDGFSVGHGARFVAEIDFRLNTP